MTFPSSQQPVLQETPHGALYILHRGLPEVAEPVAPSLFSAAGGADSRKLLECDEDSLKGIPCLRESLSDDVFLVFCGATTSSFDVAWNLVERGALPEWGMVMVASQERGRGQLRREWVSPPGNLYGTLRLPARDAFSEASASVFVGALVAWAIRRMGAEVRVKWPNDLVASDTNGEWGKVGGILLEERHGTLLAGIGLNIVSSPPDSMLRRHSACSAFNFSDLGKEKPFLPLITGMIQLVGSIRFCYAHFLHRRQRHEQLLFAEKELAFTDVPVHIHDGESSCGPFWIQGLETSRDGAGGLRLCDARGKERLLLSGSIFPEKNF